MTTLSKALQAAAGNAGEAVYVEDVFSTYLYTGNGSTQTITNGIDLAGEGGLVWLKGRSGATDHALYDTTRGATKDLVSNSTAAETTQSTGLTAFNSNGFSLGALAKLNTSSATYASWTFRKQAKFFDVVTWTGNNVNGRVIPHSLDAEVGFIAVKAITTSANDNNWVCRHRSQTSPDRLYLNTTGAASGSTNLAPTTTGFTVYANGYNETGVQYVAYLFAHDAGGFGLSGTDNVISCGSFTTDGSTNATINLGWEPQWILTKDIGAADDWRVSDNMRGLGGIGTGSITARLVPNTSGAENASTGDVKVFATGANISLNASRTYIYIAIRRGPMKVPTSGTSVFSPPTFATGSTATRTVTTNFVVDLNISKMRALFSAAALTGAAWSNRLTGAAPYLLSSATSAEATQSNGFTSFASNTGYTLGADTTVEAWNADNNYAQWSFRRAPGFFDVVCYTGDGVQGREIAHNLGSTPNCIIVKKRNDVRHWAIYHSGIGATKYLFFTTTGAGTSNQLWDDTTPTDSVFTVGNNSGVNALNDTYVAYLFATCPGVSKVGSYTGTGTTLQIDCGFTGGARFILIKRTDSTGDWYVWDTARGIVAGNDPYLLLNSTAAEVTSTDYIDPYSAGFEISSTAPAAINASGGSFIYLAIA